MASSLRGLRWPTDAMIYPERSHMSFYDAAFPIRAERRHGVRLTSSHLPRSEMYHLYAPHLGDPEPNGIVRLEGAGAQTVVVAASASQDERRPLHPRPRETFFWLSAMSAARGVRSPLHHL